MQSCELFRRYFDLKYFAKLATLNKYFFETKTFNKNLRFFFVCGKKFSKLSFAKKGA